jgi:cholesterol oxidase
VYGNTLPLPKDGFFRSPSWKHLADWRAELEPHYATARRMLGATPNPKETPGDRALKEIANEIGRSEHYGPTDVGVFFGQPGRTVRDPFFGGAGPDRTGCTFCGGCMTGCRIGAKNTLDRNYLFLAERLGVPIEAETEVMAVRPRASGGYVVETKNTFGGSSTRLEVSSDKVICAGGVMGTMPLLLKMRDDPAGLPKLSARLGDCVRTNSEVLVLVISPDRDDLSDGIAITSILHTDEHSHMEPARYAAGSGFFRTMALPHARGPTVLARIASALRSLGKEPRLWAHAMTVNDFARHSQVLLYMRTLDATLSLRMGRNAFTGFRRGLVTKLDDPSQAPRAFMPEADDLVARFAKKVGGVPVSVMSETFRGVPTTAHILGGACIGAGPNEGVVDTRHRVFGYDGLYVIDGSSVSANPGVNPSLTIAAMAERAMSFVPTAVA